MACDKSYKRRRWRLQNDKLCQLIQPKEIISLQSLLFVINLVISTPIESFIFLVACIYTICCDNSSSCQKNCMVRLKLRQIGNLDFFSCKQDYNEEKKLLPWPAGGGVTIEFFILTLWQGGKLKRAPEHFLPPSSCCHHYCTISNFREIFWCSWCVIHKI